MKLRYALDGFVEKMQRTVVTYSLNRQHGGIFRHAVSYSIQKKLFAMLGALVVCSSCQASFHDPASKSDVKKGIVQNIDSPAALLPAATSKGDSGAEQATKASVVGDKRPSKEESKKPPFVPLSGTFRLTMSFDKGVKVKVKSETEGGSTTQPDGSQVSLLEVASRDGKIVKCVQTSLKGVKALRQPICSANDDEIKLVFADEKAAFSATMEAVLRPAAIDVYKGPLLIRAIIIPNGKRIGEITLSRP